MNTITTVAGNKESSQNDSNSIAIAQLEGIMNTRFAEVDAKLEVALEGVSNFRKFQASVSKKINFVHGAIWAWSVLGVVMMSMVYYTAKELEPALKEVMITYYQRHSPYQEYQNYQMQPTQTPVLPTPTK